MTAPGAISVVLLQITNDFRVYQVLTSQLFHSGHPVIFIGLGLGSEIRRLFCFCPGLALCALVAECVMWRRSL